jgi:hypothetical protein
MIEIQIKDLASWSEKSWGGEVLEKDLEEVSEGKKRKTTPTSIYNIGNVENPLDFHPAVDIRFVRT